VPESELYRSKQAALISNGKFGAAIQLDIDDIRKKFDDKYDEAILEMLGSLEPQMKKGLRIPPF
jgi:hypothetical protein